MRRNAARLSLAVVLVVAVVTLGALLGPRLVGMKSYVVTSGSMRPTFGPGAIVVSGPVSTSDLRVGDVITFQTSEGPVTHRIVSVHHKKADGRRGAEFVTQGDANNAPDLDVRPAGSVIGEFHLSVPYVGYVIDSVKSPLGIGVLLALLALALSGGAGRKDRSLDDAVEDREPAVPVS